MSQRLFLPFLMALVLASCSDTQTPTAATAKIPEIESSSNLPTNARERLASRLAIALADPALRQEFATRFAQSPAPEGKLQFQTLASADGNRLLTRLATGGSESVAELLTDLDAAHQLELYLPVPEHRANWQGGAQFLVATAEYDHDRPIAYDSKGIRHVLSADAPPSIPVIALVPQEYQFDQRRPLNQMSCVGDGCFSPGGSESSGSSPSGHSGPTGLYLTESHFNSDFEGWLKGAPEYEFHVYGEVAGKSTQLSCTSERSYGEYHWDTDDRNWQGKAALLTREDIDGYLSKNPKGIIRIMAWEDDQDACLPRTDAAKVNDLLTQLEKAYSGLSALRLSATLPKGVTAATATWNFLSSFFSFIATKDDLIGVGIDLSLVEWMPGNNNISLKGENKVTNGMIGTAYYK